MILCGGRGTRLQERGSSLPKPLVEIGGRPILWHVIQIYLAQGFRRFVLLTGYRGEQVQEFVDAESWPRDARDRAASIPASTRRPAGGSTGGARARRRTGTFCLAYADGVADIDLGALLAYHREHGRAATMAVVQPRLPFGVARLDGNGSVVGFTEKPRSDLWVNAGFFCLERAALDVIEPDSVLEREPLERLAAAGQLRAFRHQGFWDCMDTYKDAITLNDLWADGHAPWKLWE